MREKQKLINYLKIKIYKFQINHSFFTARVNEEKEIERENIWKTAKK